ncbi:response regulator transcription factor [Streptomyces kaempferi]|uniref:Response regulator transcription factor n=1 Tax=Streptomyces kaempferi TaxID=333725 RepID=A0ABW3XYQ3_9ACTN
MRSSRPGAPLVTREVQILKAIADGGTYTEIAADLQLAHASVKNYAHSAIKKLGARSQAHAVHLAWESGLFRRERHGDHAGFAAHRYRDEEPCDDCWAGERAYRAGRRQKRRQEPPSARRGARGRSQVVRAVRGGDRPSEASQSPQEGQAVTEETAA